MPSLRSGAVPELGAQPQEQTFILVASGKPFMLFLGGASGQGRRRRMTGRPILPASMPVLYQLPGFFPFIPFFSSY